MIILHDMNMLFVAHLIGGGVSRFNLQEVYKIFVYKIAYARQSNSFALQQSTGFIITVWGINTWGINADFTNWFLRDIMKPRPISALLQIYNETCDAWKGEKNSSIIFIEDATIQQVMKACEYLADFSFAWRKND